jgi:rsbT co-antagonist protein RsbR
MPKALTLPQLIAEHEEEILQDWLRRLQSGKLLASGRLREAELRARCTNFLSLLAQAMRGGNDITAPAYDELRDMLGELSRQQAQQGLTPTDTATLIFSLKEPLFLALNRIYSADKELLAQHTWTLTLLLDGLGLYTFEVSQKSREEIISRQQSEIAELSTPVVQLWRGILALPLIGTLDSQRTQVVMESLLQRIVDTGASIAIIDITGVPTVDTLVAQHLLKTVAAARLMGADCIISGIRPQIAQTIVHLGVELNVVSKANLADALALALQRTGQGIVKLHSER